MLKNILIALDKSKPGLKAQNYAIALAQQHKAKITAVGIIDTPWITAAQPEPLGGSSFKIHRDAELIQQSHHYARHLLEDYKQTCENYNIPLTTIEVEGLPAVVIERLSHEHDIIVMGKTADFHFDLDVTSDLTVKHVARDNPRPLIIVPEHHTKSGKILVTKDGSVAASRALHMFLLLGLGKNQSIEVLSIHKDGELAQVIAEHGVRLCQAHGVKASSRIIEHTGQEASIIVEHAATIEAQMIVMGGFSHSSFKEALFGSCSKQILKESNIPLFIHH